MTIGILGGGQLGRMLALAGYPLGLQFKIFDPSPGAPAGQLAPLLAEDINDTPALLWFSRGLDAVTYEWENVPVASARYINQRVPVFRRRAPSKSPRIESSRKGFSANWACQRRPLKASKPASNWKPPCKISVCPPF